MGGKKKYIEIFGSFTEPFNLKRFRGPLLNGPSSRGPLVITEWCYPSKCPNYGTNKWWMYGQGNLKYGRHAHK